MEIGSNKWNDTVKKGLTFFHVEAGDDAVNQLTFHAAELLRWNAKTNLTAIKDPFEVAVKHVIDSSAPALEIKKGASVLDIGTGGGFPGIPLKILIPSLSMTLVDSSRKKVSFLKHIIRSLSLDAIDAIHFRGEELSRLDEYRGAFDYVICRAFSGLDVFVPMALPFIKKNGTIIAMKGRETEHETGLLKDILAERWDGARVTSDDLDVELKSYKLPFIDSGRAFFIIKLKK